ncbi:hypothetical protein PHYSODRAFT_342423 [Phytophthora sojae]|uniref:Uncharacterized protein n=1 Tax=Phytophthora sojae (strain P6497) TaxID=1094619 RepID=G5AGC6_PHYSP|nr:hypothetical protein PHYSODRAFT_342423 [Phytophthora sojae]EGZ05638.1 hypothetical protein PHYSODRAFT_342423 [Phytophthora sojae]|eukprot:XP_009539169.1 hypothetical protein PHYSODRAFT_342423 [Phytophthora sojae]
MSSDPEEDLHLRYLLAAKYEEETADQGDSAEGSAEFEHQATNLELDDYARELAFLPDVTEAKSTQLDYEATNGQSLAHTRPQSTRLYAISTYKGICRSANEPAEFR